MKRLILAIGLVLSSTVTLRLEAQSTFYWDGVGAGWAGGATPPNDGTANLVYYTALERSIDLTTALNNANSIQFVGTDTFYFTAAAPLTLNVSNGETAGTSDSGLYAIFSSNVTVNLTQAQVLNSGTGTTVFEGGVTGTGPVTLEASAFTSNSLQGGFVFYNTSPTSSTYTGGTTIEAGAGSTNVPYVSFFNSAPFGTGDVTIDNGVQFSTHGTFTVANNFIIAPATTLPVVFRNWEAPATYSGNFTLESNETFKAANALTNHILAPDATGEYPLPGTVSRYPTIITGDIAQSGGTYGLSLTGPGIVILDPTSGSNTYAGGTKVLNNGSLVFGNLSAIPATGVVTVGPVGGNASSGTYAGLAETNAGDFATFLAKVNLSSSGAVGVDTMPGSSISILSDAIDLSSFTDGSDQGLRLGSATSAVLTGTITPQVNTVYHFGNGGGQLFVQSALVDAGVSTPRSVLMDNGGGDVPLKLYLQGSNSYSGGTTANSGFIIFDGANALPASGQLVAGGSTGDSYIGYTNAVTGMTPAAFLALFNASATTGIIGFDTHFDPITKVSDATVTIGDVNLTGFTDGVFIGTSSSAILNGTLTASTVANASYNAVTNPDPNLAPNTLRFTAGNGGTLTVNSVLSDSNAATGPLSVVIGTPSQWAATSDGTVVLNGANTYTGGTYVNSDSGITLSLGNSGALGTGALNVIPSLTSGLFGLSAATPGLNIPNTIVFQTPDYSTNNASMMVLTGTQNFTLSGSISSGPIQSSAGSPPATIELASATPITVTISGNNSGYNGDWNVVNGTLNLDNNLAAGNGSVYLESAQAAVAFTSNAMAPVLWGLGGEPGSTLTLPDGANLTIHSDGPEVGNSKFLGTIQGAGGASTTASLTVTAAVNGNGGTQFVYLGGSNTYTGGTTILGQGGLALGSASSAGTGTITVNAPQGGLVLNSNVTLTNPMVLQAGGLGGLGTFTPSSINGDSSASRTITFGTGDLLFPGIPLGNGALVGQLGFGTNVAFATGGSYFWGIMDPSRSDGSSSISITGTLDLSSLSGTSQFTIKLQSYLQNGDSGVNTALVNNNSYSFTLATASGGILGFNAADFAFDTSNFQNGTATFSNLSVSEIGNSLELNFTEVTPVPEPATWALLVSGAMVAIGAYGLRRRARAA